MIDEYLFDDLFFYDKLDRIIKEWETFFDDVLYQKGHDYPRCPECGTLTLDRYEIEKVVNKQCKSCFTEFSVQRIGSIYFIIAFNEKNH